MRKATGAAGLAAVFLALTAAGALAHGDVTPHPVDTTGLPALGKTWLDANPWRGNAKAEAIGAVGYYHNCAACHGLNAESGGMAPDLLQLAKDCVGDTSPKEKRLLLQGLRRLLQGRCARRQEEHRGPPDHAELQQRLHPGSRMGDQGLSRQAHRGRSQVEVTPTRLHAGVSGKRALDFAFSFR